MGKAHFESGGIAIARAIREEYIKNPNRCLTCDAAILPKDGQKLADTRKKKFCSQKCNGAHSTPARYAQRQSISKAGVAVRQANRKFVACSCGSNTNVAGITSPRKYCPDCREENKNAIKLTLKRDSTHSKIRSNARIIARVHADSSCQHCGYCAFVEVCHIKPVRDHPEDATLGEINDPHNLLILCRNHHWEFDHGILLYDPEKKILTPAVASAK